MKEETACTLIGLVTIALIVAGLEFVRFCAWSIFIFMR